MAKTLKRVVKKYKITERWRSLSPEEKIAEVRQTVGIEGLEYDEAAIRLGASKGMVAGICFRKKIKKPKLKPALPAPNPLKPLHKPELPLLQPLPKPAVAVMPVREEKVRPQLAGTYNACKGEIVDGLGFSHECGYAKAEGSEYCEYLHFANIPKKTE
jgi:hypothetical protein